MLVTSKIETKISLSVMNPPKKTVNQTQLSGEMFLNLKVFTVKTYSNIKEEYSLREISK